MFLYSGNAKNSPSPHNKKLLLGVAFNPKKQINKLNELNNFANYKYLLGVLSYDIKNSFEKLNSENEEIFKTDDISFFEPDFFIELDAFGVLTTNNKVLFNEIQSSNQNDQAQYNSKSNIDFTPDCSDNEYLKTIASIKQEIINGNVYELNYCRNYSGKSAIDPLSYFENSLYNNPTPYACIYKKNHQFAVSNSMERFLVKSGNKLTSQPIKGTLKNSGTNLLAEQHELQSSEKDCAENLMIVDLVRNDLSKCSKTNSVKVDELYGIYSYESVHQMISTISSIVEDSTSISEIIMSLFPMGSMTGAPKLSAMKLIEKFENFRRGLFSGSMGYIDPKGNFDFNVVIRTVLYNAKTKEINIPVGSAITIDSDAQAELEECHVKIDKIKKMVSQSQINLQ